MILGEIVGEDYQVIKKIGEGSFGFVYQVRHRATHELYAIKTDQKSVTKTQLQNQVAALRKIHTKYDSTKKSQQHPKRPISICLQAFFSQTSSNKMLMPLHGQNLMNLFQKCNGRFDGQTIYEISKGMLRSIEFIHNLGFIHRDIKPQNFVAGRGYDDNAKDQMDDEIYLVDFGLAREYLEEGVQAGQYEHVKYKMDRKIRGTFMYMSVNVILGIEPSRRDDLESLMYVVVLFLKGRLPWHNINVTRKNFEELIMAKISTDPEKLFQNLPNQLKQAFLYIRKLKFEQTPNYSKILQSLESVLSYKNAKVDEEYGGKYRKYCWEVMYEKESMKELKQTVQKYINQKAGELMGQQNMQKEFTVMSE